MPDRGHLVLVLYHFSLGLTGGIARIQVMLGLASIWNGLQTRPVPVIVVDYIRGGQYDPEPTWPVVVGWFAIAAGGALSLTALALVSRHPRGGKALVLLGATFGLVLFSWFTAVPLLLAFFGLTAITMRRR